MSKHFVSYCLTCNDLVDFFRDDILESTVDGNHLVECPYCGRVFTSHINDNDLIDNSEDEHGHLDYSYE